MNTMNEWLNTISCTCVKFIPQVKCLLGNKLKKLYCWLDFVFYASSYTVSPKNSCPNTACFGGKSKLFRKIWSL